MTERPYHHGNLRAELLEHAWKVVERDGVDGLSLRGISREIGVSHSASGRHFRDRQQLLDALARMGFHRLNQAIAAATAPTATVEERLRASGRSYVEFAVAHARVLDLMYAQKRHPDASEELRSLSEESMSLLVETITGAQAEGIVRAGDPHELAVVVFASVHGVATLATDDLLDDVPWERAAESTIDFAWRGIAARPERPL
ncbi:MAG TPA: WHG domain-containing protein [Pseudonocardia sp.]|nr:WHG domain-containing protein [Pseudonocardia sp.]